MQDRGNCTWKSLSTWFRAQCADQTVTITEEIVKQAESDALYAVETLKKMVGQVVPLNRFFKIIGYEKVRFEINELFFRHVESGAASSNEDGRTYGLSESVGLRHKKVTSDKSKALRYLSSLATRIHKESALERYQKKDEARRRRKLYDDITDKFWSLFRFGK